MINYTSLKDIQENMTEDRIVRLVNASLRSQERSKERSKKDREDLKVYRELQTRPESILGNRVDMTKAA